MITCTETSLDGVLLVEPRVFGDDRGFFFESWNHADFAEVVGLDVTFVQDNHSRSARDVVRGLHYQLPPHPQGKLVRCVVGAVWDVAVDVRRGSPTLGEWFGVELTAEGKEQLWIPPGFAHGFLALTEGAELLYKASGRYAAACERAIAWDDPHIGIEWPLDGTPVLSPKDRRAPAFADAEVFDVAGPRPLQGNPGSCT